MQLEPHDYDGISYRAETKSPLIFRLLFTVLVLWGIAFMGHYLFGGWSSLQEFTQKKKAKEAMLAAQAKPAAAPAKRHSAEDTKEYIAAGKAVFAERCAACHGAEAKGGIGPDLTRKDYKYGKSEEAIIQSVGEGRPGGMPAFKNDLSHEKLEGVAYYLLSL